MDDALIFSVSEFVAVLNQTLEYAYPSVTIQGELANFRVSKNRWVYFDLKDELATVRFFGTVYQLPGPLEDGMVLKVRGMPRLHQQYGFSVNVQTIQPAGEGTIRRAAELLQTKLAAEGLFDEDRKRTLPYPPDRIGLITSKESAAYADFTKILRARWPGLEVILKDVQVQGEAAPAQIVEAVQLFNQEAEPPEVLILIRGGGSPEDLAAFSTEQVTRAVAASRVPTLVAIGHEVDISLAELAADQRASTPSNAAELLVPDRHHVLRTLGETRRQLGQALDSQLKDARTELAHRGTTIGQALSGLLHEHVQLVSSRRQLLQALNPEAILGRGFAIVRKEGKVVRGVATLKQNDIVNIRFADGHAEASVRTTENM
ncbi:MAG TPA: exodeoxyribonuclease VII large subunit [Candidatus Saccharimonadales bacterium]|nr:exodeoxyribonuclease VII large subunit [Candidatus Saccharimonadales bacterium]